MAKRKRKFKLNKAYVRGNGLAGWITTCKVVKGRFLVVFYGSHLPNFRDPTGQSVRHWFDVAEYFDDYEDAEEVLEEFLGENYLELA